MITTYEFPNQWNWRIFLGICNNNEKVDDIINHLNKKEKCNFKGEHETDNVCAPCFICDPKNLIGIICINKFELNSMNISICVHELIHLMIYISNISGCPINFETSECWAYFIGNMTHMMVEILNQHFNEERIENV